MKLHKSKLLSLILCIIMVCGSMVGLSSAISFNSPSVDTFTVGNEMKFVQVTGGLNFSLALTATGDVYSWGSGIVGGGNTVPTKVTISDLTSGEVVVKIAASRGAALMLTNKGNVYVWGSGNNNQCGFGDITTNSHTAVDVPAPKNISDQIGTTQYGLFNDIAAGDYHMLVLGTSLQSNNAVVLTWGLNLHGQCARDIPDNNVQVVNISVINITTYTGFGEPSAVFASGNSSAIVFLNNGKHELRLFGRNRDESATAAANIIGHSTGTHITLSNSVAEAIDFPSIDANGYKVVPDKGMVIDSANVLLNTFSMGTHSSMMLAGAEFNTFKSVGYNANSRVTITASDSVTLSTSDPIGSRVISVASAIYEPNVTITNYIYAALETSDAGNNIVRIWGSGAAVNAGTENNVTTFSALEVSFGYDVNIVAIYSGYECIYAVSDTGKLFVYGNNRNTKLCNSVVQTSVKGPYPINFTTLSENTEITHKDYNSEKLAFVGKASPTEGDGYSNTIRIFAKDLVKSNDTVRDKYIMVGAVGDSSLTTVYGENKSGLNPVVTGDGNANVTATIKTDGAEPYLELVFLKKTTGNLTVTFSVGNYVNGFDETDFSANLLQTQQFTLKVVSLNSTPSLTNLGKQLEDAPQFASADPNINVEGKAFKNFTLSDFAVDADGDQMFLILDEGSVTYIGDASTYILVELEDAVTTDGLTAITRLVIKAIKTPSSGKVLSFDIIIADNTESTVKARIFVSIQALPNANILTSVVNLNKISENGAGGLIDVYVLQITQQCYKTVSVADLYNDATNFSFSIVDSGAVSDNDIADYNLVDSNRTLILNARMLGRKYFNVRVALNDNSASVVIVVRVDVIVKEAPRFVQGANQIKIDFSTAKPSDFTFDISDLFVSSTNGTPLRDDFVIRDVLSNASEVMVDRINGGKGIAITPIKNGENFNAKLTVTDGINWREFSLNISISNYYVTSRVTLTGRTPQIRDVSWLVAFVNNSTSGSTNLSVDSCKIHSVGLSTAAAEYIEVVFSSGTLTVIPKKENTEDSTFTVNIQQGTGSIYSIAVPFKVQGVYTIERDIDYMAHKQLTDSRVIEITAIELANIVTSINASLKPNTTIDSILYDTTNVASVTLSKETRNIQITPKREGQQKFDIVLSNSKNFYYITYIINVSNIATVPTLGQYDTIVFYTLLIALVLIIILFVIRIIVYAKRKRIYKQELAKYNALNKIRRNSMKGVSGVKPKEDLVKAKLSLLDPKRSKAMEQLKIEQEKQRKKEKDKEKEKEKQEALKTQLAASASGQAKPVSTQFVPAVPKGEAGPSPQPMPNSAMANTGFASEKLDHTTVPESDRPSSLRDEIEEKIKAKIAAEQAAQEEQAKEALNEELEFKNMTKAERKKAEMLKKLRAKHAKGN